MFVITLLLGWGCRAPVHVETDPWVCPAGELDLSKRLLDDGDRPVRPDLPTKPLLDDLANLVIGDATARLQEWSDVRPYLGRKILQRDSGKQHFYLLERDEVFDVHMREPAHAIVVKSRSSQTRLIIILLILVVAAMFCCQLHQEVVSGIPLNLQLLASLQIIDHCLDPSWLE
jgi:hypothetical protein